MPGPRIREQGLRGGGDQAAAERVRQLDGFEKMVWTVGHMDRNHWLPEDPINAPEVYVANQFRATNPNIPIRLIVWDPALTHYGHLELPRQKAAADYSVIRWLVK
jgi:hypothetical protein